MTQWVEVGKASSVAEGRGRTFRVAGRALALFNDDGTFYATDDACPHQGASLAAGAVVAGNVVCPLHSWMFDLATGRCPRGSHPDAVAVYPVRCVAGTLEVELPAGENA